MESIAGIAVADLGLTGLLAIAVLLILGGGLVPRWLYRSALAEKDKQIEEHREDKAALRKLVDEKDRQLSMLIPNVELPVRMADALKRLAEGEES